MNSFFFSIFYVTRMVFYNLAAEHMAVNMRIDFRSSNAFMPQHTLDGA